MRTFRLFRNYGAACLGNRAADWSIQQLGMDPDYLVHAHHQTSYRLLIDYISLLNKQTPLQRDIQALVKPLNLPVAHGALADGYDASIDDSFSAVRTLVENVESYELNFRYQVEDRSESSFEVSARPLEHSKRFRDDCEDAGIGRFLCDYKAAFIAQFSTYGQRSGRPLRVTHPDEHCVFTGADRCIFFVSKAA